MITSDMPTIPDSISDIHKNGSGNAVVEYTYDSWGKKLSCTGTLATSLGVLNPFRYRGHVYDEETGFYYLRSRYYDPETCRFISADVLLSTGQGVLGHNCYAYCLNNAINMMDNGGRFPVSNVMEADSGGSQVIFYNVPSYSQKSYALCWAVCQVMVTHYFQGIVASSNEEALAQAIRISKKEHRSEDEAKWNSGGTPQNRRFFGIPSNRINGIDDLYDCLKNYGPMYARYESETDAHLVVIIGVNKTNNTVITNNPWGYKGSQDYNSFINGFVDKDNKNVDGFRLTTLYYINWFIKGDYAE